MQGFRSSINLQLDLSNPGLLDRYILTPAHSEVLNGILEGITEPYAKHAHLLIGPYGTGKSYLSTIVCQLLSRRFSSEWQSRLLLQAERMDTLLAGRLRHVASTKRVYIPVMINGRTGSLRAIINQAIFRALQQASVTVGTPNEAASILSTVERWKRHYSETYHLFLHHLTKLGMKEKEWRKGVKEFQEDLIQDFIAFYPSVTSGTPWVVEHDAYFIENLEQLSAELEGNGLGLVIVYDEFGRFLQSLGDEHSKQDMLDLQNLAEFVDRKENVHLLVIGHKHIRQYAVNSRESIRSEFEKVEKRFRFYSLMTDVGTFLQLAQEALSETNALCLKDAAKLEKIETLQRYSLFAEFTSFQLADGMINGLYPLHPVAVMLLPHLSNVFGQNERTLFSFLSDNERYSLVDHVQHSKNYYCADQLFDFFDVGLVEHIDLAGLHLYHTIAPFLNQQYPNQRRIVQLLTMWTVTRLTQKQAMSTEFLAFSLQIALDEATEALRQLSTAKIVRNNAMRGQWELYDGSSVDLELIVSEKLASASLQDREGFAILERHLPMTFILPYEYNDEMDMLRYADIRFTDLEQLKMHHDISLLADDRVWLVVYQNKDQMDHPLLVMGEITQPQLVIFPDFTIEKIQSSLLRFKVVEQLLQDSVFLAQDARLKNELTFMLEEISIVIKAFASRYLDFAKLECWSGTQKKQIKDMLGLEQLVTERLRQKYHQSPLIRNEAFNRSHISAIQKRALIDVIDRLIQNPEEPSLGITGYGPNYLIYATALKNNNYFIDEQNEVQCGDALRAVRDALRDRIDHNPVGNLYDLIELMRDEPYGIRPSVIPLLFVALLRDRWDQLLFYANDMLTTHLTGASVLELVELADTFEYRHYKWTLEEKNQLLELGQAFELSEKECTSFLQVADVALNWLRGLPKFSQITEQASTASLNIRSAIRSAEIDPYTYMKQLALSGDSLAAAKIELEGFLQQSGEKLERMVLELTGQPSIPQMLLLLKQIRQDAIEKNSRLLAWSETEEAAEIDRLAEYLVGVPRNEWSDATQELFLNQIRYEWELLNLGEENAATHEMRIGSSVEMSKKSLTLYANVKNMLKYAGKDVSTQELKQLLSKLLNEL